jgi:hypothetical protein
VEERNQYGDALFSMKYITDAAVSEEAIKYAQLLLKSLPLVDQLAHLTAFSLGDLRHRVFERTDDVEHLNASITSYRDLLSMPGAQWMHFRSIRQLVVALLSRFQRLEDVKDLEEVIRLFVMAVNDSYANVPSRFKVACDWASLARILRHPSVTAAFDSAFSSMQDSLVYAPTLETQHFHLIGMHVRHEKLPLDYASHLIHTGQIEQAVETLERGRGLLFS